MGRVAQQGRVHLGHGAQVGGEGRAGRQQVEDSAVIAVRGESGGEEDVVDGWEVSGDGGEGASVGGGAEGDVGVVGEDGGAPW